MPNSTELETLGETSITVATYRFDREKKGILDRTRTRYQAPETLTVFL